MDGVSSSCEGRLVCRHHFFRRVTAAVAGWPDRVVAATKKRKPLREASMPAPDRLRREARHARGRRGEPRGRRAVRRRVQHRDAALGRVPSSAVRFRLVGLHSEWGRPRRFFRTQQSRRGARARDNSRCRVETRRAILTQCAAPPSSLSLSLALSTRGPLPRRRVARQACARRRLGAAAARRAAARARVRRGRDPRPAARGRHQTTRGAV